MTLSLSFIFILCFVAQFLTLVLFYDILFPIEVIWSCMFYIEWYFAPMVSQINDLTIVYCK